MFFPRPALICNSSERVGASAHRPGHCPICTDCSRPFLHTSSRRPAFAEARGGYPKPHANRTLVLCFVWAVSKMGSSSSSSSIVLDWFAAVSSKVLLLLPQIKSNSSCKIPKPCNGRQAAWTAIVASPNQTCISDCSSELHYIWQLCLEFCAKPIRYLAYTSITYITKRTQKFPLHVFGG